VRRALAAAAALAVLVPAMAAACPACATRDGYGTGTALLIGGLIGAPYLVVVVALKIIRRLDKDSL
jgi:hypothetical protein